MKKGYFSSKMFVFASISALLVLVFLFTIFDRSLLSVRGSQVFQGAKKEEADRGDNIKSGNDPLITPNPDYEREPEIDIPAVGENDVVKGPDDASIVIVEYGDHLCDFCARQEDVISEVIEDNPGKVRFVWKDYPEKDENSLSWQAGKAGRCADKQGDFWDYHKRLFDIPDLKKEDLVDIARELELDMGAFKDCLRSEEVEEVMENNIKEAQNLGIYGIPFIFVNDRSFRGEVSYREIEQIIKNDRNKEEE